MKLFEFGPTRSIRVRWTLQELGVPFEAVTVNLIAGEHRAAEYLKINPAGKIPTLIDGDLVLTESIAIVLYLAEKYPEKHLIPTDLGQRAELNTGLILPVTVGDFVMAYTLDWANEVGLLDDCPHLQAYIKRMYARPYAAPRIAAAFASLTA